MPIARRHALVCIGVLALASCSHDSVAPQGPGTLRATLVSPNGAEGAAVFQISGSGYGAVTPVLPNTFVVAGPPARVTVVSDAPGTLAFDIAVDELTQPPTVAIVEVAAPDNALRTDLSRYRVTWQTAAAASRVAR